MIVLKNHKKIDTNLNISQANLSCFCPFIIFSLSIPCDLTLIVSKMKNTSIIQRKNNYKKRFYHPKQEKRNHITTAVHPYISIEERFLLIKIRHIIDELSQMLMCIEKMEWLAWETIYIQEQIQYIQEFLRSMQDALLNKEIIHTIWRYLDDMKILVIESTALDIWFYKKLFESVVIAISRDLLSVKHQSM